jgi:hypothetical protein
MLIDSPSNEPLCGCETFNRKRAFVKSAGKPVAEVPVFGIASVFTPSKNRGKGYAGQMMRLLAARLREQTAGKGFSVLYSDIGPSFYDKNGGWKAYEGSEIDISNEASFAEASEVGLLTLEDAEECIDRDIELLREEMGYLNENYKTVQFVPQHAELEWAVIRGRHMISALKQSSFVGAKISDNEKWGYITWYPDPSEDSLVVLRLREPISDCALEGLLLMAIKEAREIGLRKVKIWSPSPRLLALLGEEKIIREEHIPCLLLLGDEENVHWRNIERLGWC